MHYKTNSIIPIYFFDEQIATFSIDFLYVSAKLILKEVARKEP